ncbi:MULTISPECIES: glycosyltransferase [unclassified Nocardioides]|uniref:glycosyltransferase n=1 Tax=unclassified Nocardioides TaxID=2615069 RepID=UPI00361CDDD7
MTVGTTWRLEDVDLLGLLDRLPTDATPAPVSRPEGRLRWVAHSFPDVPRALGVPSPPAAWPTHLTWAEAARLVAEEAAVWARPGREDALEAPHVMVRSDDAVLDADHEPLVSVAARASQVLPRRLYVLERGEGATRALRRDLLDHLQDSQRSLLLERVDEGRVVVRALGADGVEPVARWRAERDGAYAGFVARVLIGLGVETVHALHADVVVLDVAGRLGVPTIMGTAPDSGAHPLTRANDERARYEPPGLPRLGIVTPGAPDRIAPTAHVRALRRAVNAAGRGLLTWERLVASDYADGLVARPFDAMVLVRNALDADQAERVLARARAAGTRVVLDLDDDLLTDHAVDRLTAQGWDPDGLAALRRLVPEVDTVVVSTPVLADLLSGLNPNIVCRPNELDPRLWSRTVTTVDPPGDTAARVLYMGSATHTDDLALLDGVVAAVSDRLGREVVLEIVGVTPGDADGVRRLVPERTDHPGFVTWLREQAPRWDAAVAPLADTEFNGCKSDLKLLEYALLGLPAVASDVGPYAGSSLARLTANTTEAWTVALADAIRAGRAGAEPAAAAVRAGRMIDDGAVRAWVDEVLGQRR